MQSSLTSYPALCLRNRNGLCYLFEMIPQWRRKNMCIQEKIYLQFDQFSLSIQYFFVCWAFLLSWNCSVLRRDYLTGIVSGSPGTFVEKVKNLYRHRRWHRKTVHQGSEKTFCSAVRDSSGANCPKNSHEVNEMTTKMPIMHMHYCFSPICIICTHCISIALVILQR